MKPHRPTLRRACALAWLALAGCAPQGTALHGGPDGVAINYAGDLGETLPIARRHCAQYERQPVLWQAKDDTATYACVRAEHTP